MSRDTARTASTDPTAHTAQPSLAEEIARVVESVPGVAFLRPGVAGRLRSTLARPSRQQGKSGPSAAGVRLTGPDGTGRRNVEIHLVVLRQARALDVARAARRGVELHLVEKFPAEAAPARVTVTVTGQV
ncbi:hypothetical protein OHS59_03280 [Streptomyces sp. NBC_00414]|uniref:hypothetical protein n=1 Tax=Streptomyces sp. NBC_00414 TaxID=2975739 RepID=UPI002E23A6B5